MARSLFYSFLGLPPSLPCEASEQDGGMGSIGSQKWKQGSDAVHAIRMLPVVTSTDMGSFKQKGSLLAGD